MVKWHGLKPALMANPPFLRWTDSAEGSGYSPITPQFVRSSHPS